MSALVNADFVKSRENTIALSEVIIAFRARFDENKVIRGKNGFLIELTKDIKCDK